MPNSIPNVGSPTDGNEENKELFRKSLLSKERSKVVSKSPKYVHKFTFDVCNVATPMLGHLL